MTLRNYIAAAVGVFLVIVLLAVGLTAEFSLEPIVADPYQFFRDFFSQWSPALGAAGTLIVAVLAFISIYENRRSREREQEQVIHALHDEIHSNLTDIGGLRFEISERLRQDDDGPPDYLSVDFSDMPFRPIDTTVFDNMKNAGQLHLLGDIRMQIISWYTLAKLYNRDTAFQPYHLELLANLYDSLVRAIKDLEKSFRFLPKYFKEKDESQQTSAGSEITTNQ